MLEIRQGLSTDLYAMWALLLISNTCHKSSKTHWIIWYTKYTCDVNDAYAGIIDSQVLGCYEF